MVLPVHYWLPGAVLAETKAKGGKENILQRALAPKASAQTSSLLTIPFTKTREVATPSSPESAVLLCVCIWQAYWENDTMTICGGLETLIDRKPQRKG